MEPMEPTETPNAADDRRQPTVSSRHGLGLAELALRQATLSAVSMGYLRA